MQIVISCNPLIYIDSRYSKVIIVITEIGVGGLLWEGGRSGNRFPVVIIAITHIKL